MGKMSPVKSILIGTLTGGVMLPIAAALCAVGTLKSGDALEAVSVCAAVCAFASGFGGAFTAARLSGNSLIGAAVGGILTAVLLISSLIFSDGNGMFTSPLAMLAGGVSAFLLSGIKRKKSRGAGKVKARKQVRPQRG